MASIQLVVFAVADQEYGIDVSAVNGILRSKKFKIQVLPGMPQEIAGMINLRGQIKYIFNLRTKFGLTAIALSEESKFIMLNVNNSICGWIVDEVTDIVKLDNDAVQDSLEFINSFNNHYIKGIGKVDDRLIILLDPEKILSAEETATIKETANIS